MVIRTKRELRSLWEIWQTPIERAGALNHHGHNYGEGIGTDYQLQSCILIKVDVLFVSGSYNVS